MSTSPKAALLEEYALVARALAAPARLLILEQVAQGERAVEGLAERTGLTFANCSQHLQQLRRAGLVTNRREGKSILYRLTDSRALRLMELLCTVAERNLAEVGQILRALSGGQEAPEPLSRDELEARLAEGSVTLLDVRPADEFALGHIAGAMNVPLATLPEALPQLADGAEIVAYCRGPYCIYAHQAVAALRRHGLAARRMEGGLPDWRAEGRAMSPPVAGLS
ncbi:metalloregulator ArsR/SmtB family transcription factor [Aliigemmobacter aestuarii]|uniref:Metalloregulator ArsR/SmtB family transcription factor n=1 Tax=Aliigemmobacter aestuarii TaxID=1445661 RepID=A0A4S3MP36_9RHOB|nr:ArsR family transcriptional regulator [Gemmobacter aestuarii]THD83713.1 metalloregulator ArsR/SmtB family transcription factor [Gemmobacter aestuarii]